MTKHTPGPWTHAGYARSMAFRVTKTPDDATGDVCNVLAGLAAKTNEEVEANARLIAAAPDLLEALQNLIEAAESMRNTYTLIRGKTPEHEDQYCHEMWAGEFLKEQEDAARAAIAKATGEQS